MKIHFLSVALMFVCGLGLFAAEPNQEIKRLLDEEGLKYKITKIGNFSLVFEEKNDRSQMVIIDSECEKFGGKEICEVWSTCYKGDLSPAIMRWMLRKNASLKLGALECNQEADRARFSIKVTMPVSANFLRNVCEIVSRQADEMEKEFKGNDDL